MGQIFKDLSKSVGQTPIIQINKLHQSSNLVCAKLESANPLSCVKDRLAVGLITDAEKRGVINDQTMIIEPTSGNTGIGLAFVCAARGYQLTLTMPETMSIERRRLMAFLGANLVLTPGAEGMKGAIAKATQLVAETPHAWMPQQFENPANPAIHYRTTGPEIWQQTAGKIDILVAGVGTGGTITGAGKYLLEKNPKLHIVAVEPAASPVLSGGNPGPHKIQGIGAGFVPKVLDRSVIHQIIPVSNEDALQTSKNIAKKEGILCGISSGAAMYAALKVANMQEHQNKMIVVILPDTGERYISTDLMSDLV